MFQRLVGIIFGAIVAFLLLLLFHNGRLISEERSGFLIAVAAGAVANMLWPLIWAGLIARRSRVNRQATVEAEVQRQVNTQRSTEPPIPPEE